MNSLWLIFVILHAASGLVCFISGMMLLSQKRVVKRRWLLPLFMFSLLGLIVFLVGAIIAHWYDLDTITRLIYIGLFVLSLYMMYRALNARRKLIASDKAFGYVDDIGFPLIALFNGFIIVALIDLNAPGWIVAAGAVVAAVVGGRLVKKQKHKIQNHKDL